MKIYLASSYRNNHQQNLVKLLRENNHEVYDFRNPGNGRFSFSWKQVDGNWLDWSPEQWRNALRHPISKQSFENDFNGMQSSDCCVLLLPSGRSAHLEAGFMAGQGKPVLTCVVDKVEPDLMNLLFGSPDLICISFQELLEKLKEIERELKWHRSVEAQIKLARLQT